MVLFFVLFFCLVVVFFRCTKGPRATRGPNEGIGSPPKAANERDRRSRSHNLRRAKFFVSVIPSAKSGTSLSHQTAVFCRTRAPVLNLFKRLAANPGGVRSTSSCFRKSERVLSKSRPSPADLHFDSAERVGMGGAWGPRTRSSPAGIHPGGCKLFPLFPIIIEWSGPTHCGRGC
jgi:hypothetical protein